MRRSWNWSLVAVLLTVGIALGLGVGTVDAQQKNLLISKKVSAPPPMDPAMGEAWKRGVFCPLGAGVVDFPRVVESLRAHDYDGWLIVEQDVVPGENGRLHPEPFASARLSRAYLREKVGV